MIRTCVVAALTAVSVTFGPADPALATTGPYPDTSGYAGVGGLEKYKAIDREGRWFSTPEGLRCAILDDGSAGCSGVLPGTAPGINEIAWFAGDAFPRLYHTDDVKFDSGRVQTLVIGMAKLTYRGTTCAVTKESGVYCIHGSDANSQFMVTSDTTYRGPDALRD